MKPFENTKKEFKSDEEKRTARFMNLEQAACKVYLHSATDEKSITDVANERHMGLMNANLVKVGGEEKGFTRTLAFSQKQYDMFAKDGFKEILQEGESLVHVNKDLSNYTETSRNMQVENYLEITKDKESELSM
jgi:hypothetical protein